MSATTTTTITTTTTHPPFILSRASLSDIPEMTHLMYRCSPQFERELLMGCQSEDDLPKLVAHFEDKYCTHHHAVWLAQGGRQGLGTDHGGIVVESVSECGVASRWR